MISILHIRKPRLYFMKSHDYVISDRENSNTDTSEFKANALTFSSENIYISRTLEIIDTYIHNRIRIELRFLKFLNFLTS